MWGKFSKFILHNRFLLLFLFGISTAFMAWKAAQVQLAFNAGKVLPLTDTAFTNYLQYKDTFGEDGAVLVLGIQSPSVFKKDLFNDWQKLGNELSRLNGIKNVLSTARLIELEKDFDNGKFIIKPITKGPVSSQARMDAVKRKIDNLPFYRGLVYNKEKNATLMAVSFDARLLNSSARVPVIRAIRQKGEEFAKKHGVQVHYSGLPYIRTITSDLVAREFVLFLGLSIGISAIILLIFFRSFAAVFFPVLLVAMGVIWSVGTLVLFGYKITLLTGLIPPLIVIIGIPNSILLLNKYHTELRRHGNKTMALRVMTERIALTTLIANLTAAIGFGVLYFTGSELLMEFGSVAAINVMVTWLICLCLLPVIYSFLPVPKIKPALKEERTFLNRLLIWVDAVVHNRGRTVYRLTGLISAVSLIGVFMVNVNGYVVDDLPKDNAVYRDLKFFEQNFEGVLPLEVTVDTRRKDGVMNIANIKKIDRLEQLISGYPEFSRALSLNSALKYATQVFYNGDTAYYRVPNDMEKNFILSYIASSGGNTNMLKGFLDSTRQTARISFQMADVGSKRMNILLDSIRPQIDSIFSPQRYDVQLTGSGIIFLKGTDYLLRHLFGSIALAIVLISLLRWWQFKDIRMVLISLLPNIVPLLITAGIMGFTGIALKPSTILIFSIAFGLASDQTIYFLTRYQQELKLTRYSVPEVISDTIRETGVSMTYIALILFFGFGIFTASTFGGTVSLGILLSITLFMALVFNLTLLPVLVLSVDKRKNKPQLSQKEVERNLQKLD